MPVSADHIVVGDTLILSEKRPRRTFFLNILHHYSLYIGASVAFVLLASVVPHSLRLYGHIWSFEVGWTAIWVSAYAGYKIAKERLPSAIRVYRTLFDPEKQLRSSAARIIGITAYLAGLYLTPYWPYYGKEDTTWLLYVLALIVVAEYGTTEATIIATSGTAVLLGSVRLMAVLVWNTGQIGGSLWDSAIKIVWLALLTGLVQLLVKLFSYQSANLRVLREIQRALPTADGFRDQATLLARIAGLIHTNFEYKDVNILMRQGDGAARIVATASVDKSKLEVMMQPGEGITGYVLETGGDYYENDVVRGREKREGRSRYKSHPAFPGTVAELALPIKRNGEVIGVLDIQDTRPNAFIDPDIEVMRAIADHIGTVLQTAKIRVQATELRRGMRRLNQRQMNVMRLRLQGASLKEIEKSLSLSKSMVKKTFHEVSTYISQITSPAAGATSKEKRSYTSTAQQAQELNLLEEEHTS